MVRWKLAPHHLKPSAAFSDLITRLRAALSSLVGAETDEIVLANSASYGLHLIANGLGLATGDEVIVAANDFPSDILPWLRLEQFGVKVDQVAPAGKVLTAAEISNALSPRTRVVCLTWVHSFSGHVIDLDAIGELCRKHDIVFVVNGAQGVGGIPLAVKDHPIDALTSVGHKWLCGPYGTGLCWLGPRAEERIAPSKWYWLAALSAEDLADADFDLSTIAFPTTGRHDVFGTANFFNFAALAESVDLVTRTGVGSIHAHNLELSTMFIEGLDRSVYDVNDRGEPDRLSSIVFVQPRKHQVEVVAAHLEHERIDVSQRRGQIRVASHFYNTSDDIDCALAAFNTLPQP